MPDQQSPAELRASAVGLRQQASQLDTRAWRLEVAQDRARRDEAFQIALKRLEGIEVPVEGWTFSELRDIFNRRSPPAYGLFDYLDCNNLHTVLDALQLACCADCGDYHRIDRTIEIDGCDYCAECAKAMEDDDA